MKETAYNLKDKVRVVDNEFGTCLMRGTILQITNLEGLFPNQLVAPNSHYRAKDSKGNIHTVFHGDLDYGYESREEHAKALQEEIDKTKKELKKKEQEVEILLKYKDDADYWVHQLAETMGLPETKISKLRELVLKMLPSV